ncbi:MAG: pyridoxal phosphate-dependent aminotransferase [Actinomycetota bacterium]|nr:pyridoxal phosphate-dependent aminotransferase [Actinomycetota bacterium]
MILENDIISSKSFIERVGSRIMYEKGAKLKNDNCDVINLLPYPKRDFPDDFFDYSKEMIIKQNNAPSDGIPELREELSKLVFSETGIKINSEDNVLITNGGMHGLTITFKSILDPGDEVLIFAPCYFFEGIIRLAGGVPVYIDLNESDEYAYDFKRLESAVTKNTKAILLNSPTNPTGYVVTQNDIDQISRIADKYGLFIISDESYDKMIYDGYRNISILENEIVRDRVILIRSFTKSFALPGWRIGFVIAQKSMKSLLQKILEWDVLYCNYFSQQIALKVIKISEHWLKGSCEEFQRNRDIIFNYLSESKIFSAVKPKGNPFVFLNISKTPYSCEEVSQILLTKYGIPSVPGKFHRSDKHVRIAFGGDEDLIRECVNRLKMAEKYLKNR